MAELIAAAAGLDDLLHNIVEIDPTALRNAMRAIQGSVAAFTLRWQPRSGPGDSPSWQLIAIITARATAVGALLAPATADPQATADALERAAQQVEAAAGDRHASAAQRRRVAAAWRIAATAARWDGAVRAADADSSRLLHAAQRQAQVLAAHLDAETNVPVPVALRQFCSAMADLASAGDVSAVFTVVARVGLPVRLVHLSDWPSPPPAEDVEAVEEPPLAVCVASLRGAPITNVFVARPHEVYSIEMTVRLPAWPEWALQCHVEPVTRLGRDALTVPRFVFEAADAVVDEAGVLLTGEDHLRCALEQPIQSPAVDCPLVVRFTGNSREQRVRVAGYRRLRLRPFDPSRDQFTEHEQTDARLLTMYDALTDPAFDTEDVRAFCRLFTACVTAGQSIMFDKVFHRGRRVSEQQFHDELERRLRADPELGGRLTRRDAVAGRFDDLLHDDVIAELKVARNKAITVEDCAKYLGQPTQYGIGRGSQLSVLVVLDHSAKQAPPGVIDNYVGWLKPVLHRLADPRYPSLVGVLIINTNLPVPSTWSRKAIQTAPLA